MQQAQVVNESTLNNAAAAVAAVGESTMSFHLAAIPFYLPMGSIQMHLKGKAAMDVRLASNIVLTTKETVGGYPSLDWVASTTGR